MSTEESTSQPTPESPTPAIEAPALATEPVTPPETHSVPAEAVSAPETAQSPTQTGPQGPLPFSTTDDRQENQVAKIPPNEPIAPESEPIEHAPESPSAAAPVQTGILHAARDLLVKGRVAIQDRKRKKRDKIMAALNTKSKITNDEVEKLLHVSDATATRYLSVLEKEGHVTQIGRTGKAVIYKKI